MATVEALRARGPFVVDPANRVIHRTAAMAPACAAAIDEAQAQFPADMLKADLVMKTRHYSPCPVCWASPRRP